MARIKFEWGKDIRENDILIARKARGKISIAELQEEMRDDYRYEGAWAAVFTVREDMGYQGWGDEDEPKGDALELYRVDDYEKCPICAVVISGVNYCPHCGEGIEKLYGL